MVDANGDRTTTPEYQYSDDEDDAVVCNMVNLIDQQFPFHNACFSGGVSRIDVSKMREESKQDLVNRKTAKTKSATFAQLEDGVDAEWLASIVRDKVKQDILVVVGEIATLKESLNSLKSTILNEMVELSGKLEENVLKIAALSSDIRELAVAAPQPPAATSDPRRSHVDSSTQTNADTTTIIKDAIHFVNRATTDVAEVSYILVG